jgi:hypothetical protein
LAAVLSSLPERGAAFFWLNSRASRREASVQPVVERQRNHRFLRARMSQRPGRGASGHATSIIARHRVVLPAR